ncbi:MAG: sugar phosphate nucleotidyltransferase [Candidatus Omnitrophica bacterium]|nr:sugar phosphate nucleotidyltransferase [Candidatus Omnitrophota bacterium]MDD5352420.1 sugar phosphate nucleotidyltransferase [Candidatus Omnitrophota bacterium]MDD5550018.1 sugar phosphate nucleotidyltransferase [Candidatus Omnitrophota bacterium]
MKKTLLITKNISVKEAMKRMGDVGEKVLFAVDSKNKLIGSLTDGDIRRWILAGGNLSGGISKIYNKNPILVSENYSVEEVKKLMLRNKIEWIPVVNKNKEVVDVLLWDATFGKRILSSREKLSIPVVIMAGGKGTRLDPFTKILPKPLIPIGEKTILDIIMDKFSQYGIKKFYITINHKSRMIKSYFEEMNTSYTICYIEEKQPMGTIGSLSFLRKEIKDSLFVTNCDVIINSDYTEVLELHEKNKNDMTIVASMKHYTIPYGICKIENGGFLTAMHEKPEYDFLVNTGFYILRKKALNLIPDNQEFHITDLVKKLKEKNKKIGVFPINENSWIDVGQWEEYHRAVKNLGF